MSPMTRNSFIFGAAMILLALGFFLATSAKTALIPAGFGIGLVICGVVGLKGEPARKHAMHVAAVLSLLGVLTIGRAIGAVVKHTVNLATLEIAIFSGMSLVFMILCIKSFRDARKAREVAAKVAA